MRQGTGDRRQSHEAVDIWSTYSLRIAMHVMGQRKKKQKSKNRGQKSCHFLVES